MHNHSLNFFILGKEKGISCEFFSAPLLFDPNSAKKKKKKKKKEKQPNVIKTSIEPAQMCSMVSVEFQSSAFTNEVKT